MKIEAFGNLPLLKIYFNSKTHSNAWHYLLYGINSLEPFLLVTGEYGMGKTTLCLGLIRLLKKKNTLPVAYIPTPNYDFAKILSEIAAQLKLETTTGDELNLQALIYQYFKEKAPAQNFYIIIDDAHDLSISTLEKLRSLANFNHNGFFPFHFIFFAHTTFREKLRSPTLIPIDQRLKRRCHLEYLNQNEIKEYIFSRLYKSGAPGIPTFTAHALQEITAYSRGIPRLINNVCDACLLIGASHGLTEITASVVRQALPSISAGQDTLALPISSDIDTPAAPIPSTAPPKPQKPPKLKLDLSVNGAAPSPSLPASTPKAKKTAKKLAILAIILLAILLLMSIAGYLYNRFWPAKDYSTSSTTSESHSSSVSTPAKVTQRQPVQIRSKVPRGEEAAVASAPSADDPDGHAQELAGGILSLPKRGILVSNADAATYSEQVNSPFPYSLHLGSYRSLTKALETVPHFMDTGLAPYLVKVNLGQRGTWWRVYAGYFKSHQAAQEKKKWHNLSEAAIIKTTYANLIGVFTSETQLEQALKQLETLQYFPYIVKGPRNAVKVYAGAFENRTEAEAYHRRLQADGIRSQVVKR